MNKIQERYLNWMSSLVFPNPSDRLRYKTLLQALDGVDFFYILPMDENRYIDGINLRYRFGYEMNAPQTQIASELDIRECSVLEMMVALTLRCEENIMTDPDFGDRKNQWFSEMLKSLSLDVLIEGHFDESYFFESIDVFLNRKYSPNGDGGLFTIPGKSNMPQTEIWYQMCWYLDTLLY